MAKTSPSKGLLARFFGAKDSTEDIELPNESGKTDKRLPKKKKSQMDNILSGYGTLKDLGKASK